MIHTTHADGDWSHDAVSCQNMHSQRFVTYAFEGESEENALQLDLLYRAVCFANFGEILGFSVPSIIFVNLL